MKKVPLIKLDGVSKFYKTQTGVSEGMRNINLEFNLNEFVAITGESGSGKTTLLNVISGLDSYEDGELYINGLETSHFTVKDFEELRAKNIGFVFQNYNVIDSYTVYQNVVIALEAQGYDPKKKKARALELIEKVGLLSHKNQKTAKLSGGQKQRVVIARALAKNAPIILADEPTGNLDSKSGREIMELLKEISKDKLIILVTHNYEEAKDYITRNIVMSDGNVKEDKVLVKTDKMNTENTDTDSGKTKSIRKSFEIALRNVFSKPKKTIFTFILAVFSLVAITFSYYGISNSLKGSIAYNRYNSDIVYIQKKDEKSFEIDEFNRLKKKLSNKDLNVGYSIFSDETSGLVVDLYDELIDFQPKEVRAFLDDEITGRLPSKSNEVLIKSHYGFRLNGTLYIGYYELDEFGNNIIDSNGNKKIKKLKFEIVGIIDSYSYYSRGFNIYFHESFLMDAENNVNSVLKSFFQNVNDKKDEIVLQGIDRQEIKNALKKVDKDIYNVYDPFVIDEAENYLNVILEKAITYIFMFIIVMIIFLLVYLVQKNIMLSQKKDFAVYRSIGISEKEVKNAIIFDQAIIAVTASILVLITLIVIALFNRDIRLALRNIGTTGYLFISLIFIYFSVRQGIKFNKQIFSKTVISSLKEESND